MDKKADRILTRLDYNRLVKTTIVPLIVVYEHPEDYPDKFVARVWDAGQPTQIVAVADDYEGILAAIPTAHMVNLGRDGNDDACIRETWI